VTRKWNFIIILLSCFLTACTTKIINHSPCNAVNFYYKTAVVPFSNYTETPLAGERAMSITAAVLESRCIYNLVVYKDDQSGKILFPGMNRVKSQEALMRWARNQGARYMLTGSVNEWTYKVGLDGEPVVGLSMQVIDLWSGRIVWASAGSENGGPRTAVSTVAQKLINSMIKGLFPR